MIEIVTGNLLDAKEKFIAHRTNCVSQKSAGLAKQIFDKFLYSNIYVNRTDPNTPGTLNISGDGISERFVIHMFGQYYPGKPKYPDSPLDGTFAREKYFYRCLLKMAKIQDLESIAFPYGIGCGMAGGVWGHYLGTLTNFAEYVKNKCGARVVIYRAENL